MLGAIPWVYWAIPWALEAIPSALGSTPQGYPVGISTIAWVFEALLGLFAKLSSSSFSSSSLTVLLERGSAELGRVKKDD